MPIKARLNRGTPSPGRTWHHTELLVSTRLMFTGRQDKKRRHIAITDGRTGDTLLLRSSQAVALIDAIADTLETQFGPAQTRLP